MRDPGWREVVAVLLASRFALEFIGWVAWWRVPGGTPPQPWPLPAGPLFLTMWVRWDSQWFLEIAQRGYWLRDGLPVPQAFFPLYPLLIRVLTPLCGGRPYLAGLLVANTAFVLGLAAFYRLAAERWGSRVAARAACYTVLFPAGFYLSAVYSEGLFFGLAVGAFFFAARRRWAAAGLCGMGAALTRGEGVLLFPALLWEWASARRGRGAGTAARAGWVGAAWLCLVPLGLGLYMAYNGLTVGNPLAHVDAEHRWGRALHPPWAGLAQAVRNVWEEPPPRPASPGRYHNAYRPPYRRLYSTLDLLAVAGGAALLLVGRRVGVPGSWLLFGWLGLILPLFAPALRSMTPLPSSWRYLAVLFPLPVSLALALPGRAADGVVRAVFAALQGLFFLLFTTWNWIA